MAIKYDKLHTILKEKGTTLYKLHAEKVIGGKTKDVLFGRVEGNITSATINALCNRLGCQPGDIMEHIPDNPNTSQE